MTAHAKTKTPAKQVLARGNTLDTLVLDTMQKIATIVGSTLGPGGAPVLIERQEWGLPGMVTKDGVTVFNSLGFRDPMAHSIMESARDAAIRTVGEAGDGTTTATVLAWALVKHAQEFHRNNPAYAPQRIVEELRNTFEDFLAPRIQKLTKQVKFNKAGKRVLHSVAAISANGDVKLADAVLECFERVGDTGNVTIVEQSGPPSYQVDVVQGYGVPSGFEESAAKFMNVFINEGQNGRGYYRKPYFILYNGSCVDVQLVYGFLDALNNAWRNREGLPDHDPALPALNSPNVVLVANGFSESVLGALAVNVQDASTINVIPLVVPRTPLMNGEVHFLEDVAALTGATVLDPLSKPFDQAGPDDLGQTDGFEYYRFRSVIMGRNDEDELIDRADTLKGMVESAESELDKRLLQERLAALTGGIAKLVVIGGSSGELRERKDRAEDAVRAVQGALKFGALPGGGWTLARLSLDLREKFEAETPQVDVLAQALLEPVRLLLKNVGYTEADTEELIVSLEDSIQHPVAGEKDIIVFDCAKREWVRAFEDGLLDSTPAVREAIRNSISIASLLGTLGGVVVFGRDEELERREAQSTRQWERDANRNEANERW